MSILILRRIVQRYSREKGYYNGGIITGSGTSNHIPMFTSNNPFMDEIKEREYTKAD